jgi:hypothetical protein
MHSKPVAYLVAVGRAQGRDRVGRDGGVTDGVGALAVAGALDHGPLGGKEVTVVGERVAADVLVLGVDHADHVLEDDVRVHVGALEPVVA